MCSKQGEADFLKHNAYKEDYIWNRSKCIFENGKCYWQLIIGSIIKNSVITCDEIIGITKIIEVNFNG